MTDALIPDEREERLPRWARALLTELRQQLQSAQHQAEDARLATEPDSSYVLVNRGMYPPIGLGVDPTITYLHEPGGRLIYGIDVRMHRSKLHPRGRLEVTTGGMGIRISPAASNHFYVDWDYDY